MADYFEEMGWRPLGDGEEPNHLLHIARFLIDFGVYSEEMGGEWPRLPPPASTKAIAELPSIEIEDENQQCPICLKPHKKGESVKKMPCEHTFHDSCILRWLAKTNTCPLCRHELPTDNAAYEAFKKDKSRSEQRQMDLETLHNAMFS